MTALTPARRRVLELVATHPDVRCSNVTDETRPCVSTAVAYTLSEHGYVEIERLGWGPYVCRITDTGRAALEEGT